MWRQKQMYIFKHSFAFITVFPLFSDCFAFVMLINTVSDVWLIIKFGDQFWWAIYMQRLIIRILIGKSLWIEMFYKSDNFSICINRIEAIDVDMLISYQSFVNFEIEYFTLEFVSFCFCFPTSSLCVAINRKWFAFFE